MLFASRAAVVDVDGSKKNEKDDVCIDNFHETRDEDDASRVLRQIRSYSSPVVAIARRRCVVTCHPLAIKSLALCSRCDTIRPTALTQSFWGVWAPRKTGKREP
jgi:hypothetical protein